MNDPKHPAVRGWNQPSNIGGGFPGLGNPGGFGNPGLGGDPFFSGPPAFVNPTVLPPQGAGPAKGGFALGDIKNMIDRVGGIDGIISGIGKFQKFMATMQQLAPLMRLFIGKAAATKAASLGVATPARRRKSRRRNRRRTQGSRRRTGRR